MPLPTREREGTIGYKHEETLIAEYRNTRRWSLIGACVSAAAGVAFIVIDLLA